MQKEVLPLHKLQDHGYELQNPFRIKEDNRSQCHPGSPHIEQEYHRSLIKERITISKTGMKASNVCKAKLYKVMQFKVIWFTSF